MNYAHIYWNRTCDGDGVRVALYVSGCTRACRGCHNRETWDPCYGTPFTDDTLARVLDGCDHPWVSGLSLLGGDPLYQSNQQEVLRLLKGFRGRFGRGKDVWLWTGCVLERDLLPDSPTFRPSEWFTPFTSDLLGLVDVIVDGPFIDYLKTPNLLYRGSSNQRILRLVDGRPSEDLTPST